MLVRELMTRTARVCHPEESLEQAARLFWEGDVGSLPVLDSDQVVAMLTDRDVCMAAYTAGRNLANMRVSDCMSRDLVTLQPEESLETALDRMAKFRVRRLPVVDTSGSLLGVLSVADIARATANGSGTRTMAMALARALARIQASSENGNGAANGNAAELKPAPARASRSKAAKAAKAAKDTNGAPGQAAGARAKGRASL
jgi:CBS domain-containing protein